jgi:hypothetical protein
MKQKQKSQKQSIFLLFTTKQIIKDWNQCNSLREFVDKRSLSIDVAKLIQPCSEAIIGK